MREFYEKTYKSKRLKFQLESTLVSLQAPKGKEKPIWLFLLHICFSTCIGTSTFKENHGSCTQVRNISVG